MEKQTPIKLTLVWFLGIGTILWCLIHLILTRNGVALLSQEGNKVRIQDFYYYIEVVRRFWFEGESFIYRDSTMLKMMQELTHIPGIGGMPLGLTPIALIFLIPFAAIAQYVTPLHAYSCFLSISILSWGTVLIMVLKSYGLRSLIGMALLVSTMSVRFVDCLALGQLSILGIAITALAIFMPLGLRSSALALTALAVKPHYYIFGLFCFLVTGKTESVKRSIVIIILVLLGLTPLLGVTWPVDYFTTLAVFSSLKIPAYFAGAFAPATTLLFWSAFDGMFDRSGLLLLSKLLLFVALSYVSFELLRGRTKGRERVLGAILIGGYLLFTPYVGGYDDLFMVIPLFFATTLRLAARDLISLFLLIVVLNYPIVQVSYGMGVALKLLFFGFLAI